MWKKLLIVVFVAFITTGLYTRIRNIFFDVPPLPALQDETWWGNEKPFSKEDTAVEPFTINVSQTVLDNLNSRLDRSLPLQRPLKGVQQQYGMNTDHLGTIIDFWRTKYDWKEREKMLNKFPQYTVRVQGLKIHFLHVKSKVKDVEVLPLLSLHGWPSSVREFFEMIPHLTENDGERSFVFEVIAPSLPGFAFSEPTNSPGLNPLEIAVIFKNLMQRLGFERYYIHGGDWGGQIAAVMATVFPEKVLGMHSNFCFVNTPLAHARVFLGSFFPSLVVSKEEEDKIYPLWEKYLRWLKEAGYLHIQATKPDTIGVALRDSPAGLAAYLLEKYIVFTNPEWKNLEDGGLTEKFNLEDLLDNIMIYWISGSITTSMRLYAEAFSVKYMSTKVSRIPTSVPSGCARFTHEIVYQPEVVLKDKFLNLVHLADYEGGHFAAAEEPAVLANDLYLFVEKVRAMHQ